MSDLEKQLLAALEAAALHLDYCGYGDSWEREYAQASGLEKKITDALNAAKSGGQSETVLTESYDL